jgi:hypothetical protein
VRKTKQLKFVTTLPQILINLQPATTFNPYDVWERELEAERKATLKDENIDEADIGEADPANMSNTERNIQVNVDKIAKDNLIRDITKIRNTSKDDLVSIIRDIKIPQARAVLFIQILKVAYADFLKTNNKKLLYETLWAIEDISPLPEFDAPKPREGTILPKVLQAINVFVKPHMLPSSSYNLHTLTLLSSNHN